MSRVFRPLVIPLLPDGLRGQPSRLYIEDGFVHLDYNLGWRVSDVTDTGERSLPEGWPILRFASDPEATWAPVDQDMIVKGGLEALGG